MKNVLFKSIASIATVACLGGAPALAQQTAMPQQGQPNIAPVSDSEISQFVVANEKVGEIATEMNGELTGVSSQEEATEIQMKAQEKMVVAIETEGLTARRYTEIMKLAQTDPEIGKKIQSAING